MDKKLKNIAMYICRLLFVGGVFLMMVPRQLRAQHQVSILEADSIIGGHFKGERVQKILGHVHLKSQNFEMFCDSAYQFTEKNEIHAFNNIQINTRKEKIWADSLIYYTKLDYSKLRGRVIIEADSTTLFGNQVDYRFSNKTAHFIDHIRLEDQQGTLTAQTGFYFRQADSAVFRGQVQLADSLKYIEGDSLFTNRSKKYYELFGDIFADDKKNNSTLKGQYLEADSTGRRLLKGDAWLMNVEKKDSSQASDSARTAPSGTKPDSSTVQTQTDSLKIPKKESPTVAADSTQKASSDTTHIRAVKILSVSRQTAADTSTTIHAYTNVRIWSNTFSAVSDTASYSDSTETFELWSNAKSWHKHVQLTGPYIKTFLTNGDIDSLLSYPHPFAVQEDTSLNRLNQIKGDTLKAFFKDGNLHQIYVQGNSHLLRFTKNDKEQPDGAVEMTAPTTHIFFKNGKLTELKSVGSIDGSYLPESKQTADRKLEGFSWNPDLRPQRPAQKMAPRFPPIPEERPFELPKRYKEYIQQNQAKNKNKNLKSTEIKKKQNN